MKFPSIAILSLISTLSQAFVPIVYSQASISFHGKTTSISLSASRLEGNQSDPNEKDIATMDEMITKMADAKAYELPNAVRRAFRVCSSPRFFIRIAERADMTDDEIEKEKLSVLASNLAATVEAVISTTTDQLDERANDVEDVIKQASEPSSGEFLVPLSEERANAMRNALVNLDRSKLDESFLTTVDSWIVKSHQDGMDGMVTILQKLLQQYAGLQVSRARAIQQTTEEQSKPAAELFEKLLFVDTDTWDMEIRRGTLDVPSSSLLSEITSTMETVVLALENGSMAQRIQAEYLKELMDRVEATQKS